MSPRRRTDEAIRVAAIGVGGMGANHARVLASMKGVELVAVVDADPVRAKAVAEFYGCMACTSVDALPQIDAATVAVPSSLHATVGVPLLQAGVHCLIEKPLATTEADCLALMAAAEDGNAQLLVGHIERFNPAVQQLAEIVNSEEIVAIAARRMSAVSGRISDVDVVLDLMVHDLDIVLGLTGKSVSDIVARGINGPHGSDHAIALLTLENGAQGTLTASRITQNQIRHLEVTTTDHFYVINYPSQELFIYRQGRIEASGDVDQKYRLDVNTEKVFVRRIEPLAEELNHFVDVCHGDAEPKITGTAALEALRSVWTIQHLLEESTQAQNEQRAA